MKEEKFVREFIKSGNATEAAAAVCKVSTRASAASSGHAMLKRDRVQNRLAELLDAQFPLLNEQAATVISEALHAPVARSGEDDGIRPPISWADKRAFLELLIKVQGFSAPTKHQRLTAKITTPLPLPE